VEPLPPSGKARRVPLFPRLGRRNVWGAGGFAPGEPSREGLGTLPGFPFWKPSRLALCARVLPEANDPLYRTPFVGQH